MSAVDYRAGMLNAIPGYAEKLKTLETLRQWLAQANVSTLAFNRADLVAQFSDQIVAAATAGDDAPDFTDAITDFHNRAKAVETTVLARQRAVDFVDADLKTMPSAGAEAAFDWLSDQLDELQNQWAITPYRPGLTANDAIQDSQAADAYRHFDDLARRYLDLRAAHRHLLSLNSDGVETSDLSRMLAVSGQMQRSLDGEPYWVRQRISSSNHTVRSTRADTREHVSWLAAAPAPFGDRDISGQNYLVPGGVSPTDWVNHVFAHGAWLARAADIDEAHNLAQLAVRPPAQDPLANGRYVHARRAHAALTAGRPTPDEPAKQQVWMSEDDDDYALAGPTADPISSRRTGYHD